MKKLKLDLDQVRVFSFAVETTKGGKGTVNGFSTGYTAVWGEACVPSGASCESCFPHQCPDMLGSRDPNC